MKIIGLTGGIAAGKSQAASILLELGAVVIDADKIARQILAKGYPAWKRIKDHFGEDYLLANGEINRRKLGELVFSEPSELAVLNDITHPIIKRSIEHKIEGLNAKGYKGIVIVEAALLLEKGWETLADEVWVVDAPREQRIERIISRDNISREQAIRRINSQMSQQERLHKAHRVIYNESDICNMRTQIKDIWNKVKEEIELQ